MYVWKTVKENCSNHKRRVLKPAKFLFTFHDSYFEAWKHFFNSFSAPVADVKSPHIVRLLGILCWLDWGVLLWLSCLRMVSQVKRASGPVQIKAKRSSWSFLSPPGKKHPSWQKGPEVFSTSDKGDVAMGQVLVYLVFSIQDVKKIIIDIFFNFRNKNGGSKFEFPKHYWLLVVALWSNLLLNVFNMYETINISTCWSICFLWTNISHSAAWWTLILKNEFALIFRLSKIYNTEKNSKERKSFMLKYLHIHFLQFLRVRNKIILP